MVSFINYRPEGVYIVEQEGRNHRCIGGLDLYTPRTSEEVRFRMMMEAKLRQMATPGAYTGREANRLIQSLCAVADSELTRVLPKVASRSFFEFLVFMHRQWDCLITKMQHGELADYDANLCWAEAPIERSTLRYLLEKSVQLAPPIQPEAEKADVLSFTDRAYIAARQLVVLSKCSDQLHYFYPTGEAYVIVSPPRHERYLEFQLNPTAEARYQHYSRMTQESFQFVGRDADEVGELVQLLNERLNTPFSQEFGITFRQVIHVVVS